MPSLENIGKGIIKNNIYMTMATASEDGRPWATPVYFAFDKKFNFYWCSAKTSRHSKLISKNKNVAVVIFDSSAKEGTGDGVYMDGVASEVSGKEISFAMGLLIERSGKINKYYKDRSPKDYSGASPVRFYKFVPRKFWILGDSVRIGKFLVDIRRAVRIKE